MRFSWNYAHGSSLAAPETGSGFTLVEVVIAAAAAVIASLTLYGSIQMGNFMIRSAQQQLDAQALAFDQAMTIFNTYALDTVTLATNLPPIPITNYSVLPTNSEIWTAIYPAVVSNTPYRWDIEVRVKRVQTTLGGRSVLLTNDVRFVVTRYKVDRN